MATTNVVAKNNGSCEWTDDRKSSVQGLRGNGSGVWQDEGRERRVGRMTEQPANVHIILNVEKLLAEAESIDDVKEARNRTQALRVYVQKARLGRKMEVQVAVLRVRAERKLGKVLRALPLAKAAKGNQYTGRVERDEAGDETGEKPLFLRDLGITPADSSRAQRVASLPEEVFEKYVAAQAQTGKAPTISAVLRLVRQRADEAKSTASSPSDLSTGAVASETATINQLVGAKQFHSICAFPPWPESDTADSAVVRRVSEELQQLPVGSLANEAAHLHLHTRNVYLRDAIQIMEAWGFRYASTLVLQTKSCEQGPFWQEKHHLLLLGIRGGLQFLDKSWPSFVELEEDVGACFPRELRRLIEQVSPGPYLELFCKNGQPTRGWTKCQ